MRGVEGGAEGERGRLLSSTQAAERLGLSASRVRQLADRIGNVGPGREVMFREEDVEKFGRVVRAGGRPKRRSV